MDSRELSVTAATRGFTTTPAALVINFGTTEVISSHFLLCTAKAWKPFFVLVDYLNKITKIHMFPYILDCGCEIANSANNICNVTTGQCDCESGFSGRTCNSCDQGFYDYPSCTGKPLQMSKHKYKKAFSVFYC